MTSLKRKKMYTQQGGRCHYCESPMWIVTTKTRPNMKHIIRQFKRTHKIEHHHAMRLRCTVEHLVCKADGGTNEMSNLVVACLHCNSVRKDWGKNAYPPEYKELVLRRMKRGTWFAQFNPMDKFEYDYSPSVVDRLVGSISRLVWFNKPWVKRMKRSYRSYHPQYMSRVQLAQSFMRVYLTF